MDNKPALHLVLGSGLVLRIIGRAVGHLREGRGNVSFIGTDLALAIQDMLWNTRHKTFLGMKIKPVLQTQRNF